MVPVSVAADSWEHQGDPEPQVLEELAVMARHAVASALEVFQAAVVVVADSQEAVAPVADQQELQVVQAMIKELVAVAPEAHLIQVV